MKTLIALHSSSSGEITATGTNSTASYDNFHSYYTSSDVRVPNILKSKTFFSNVEELIKQIKRPKVKIKAYKESELYTKEIHSLILIPVLFANCMGGNFIKTISVMSYQYLSTGNLTGDMYQVSINKVQNIIYFFRRLDSKGQN